MTERATLDGAQADAFGFAVVATSSAPMVLLNSDLTIAALSATFCAGFSIHPDEVVGRQLGDIGAGEWAVPQVAAMLLATANGQADVESYRMDLKRAGRATRCLMLTARRLDYAGADRIRVVLSVLDVTDARAAEKLKEDLLREKAVLLQELQHRVANSLQIIASVLLQSAKRVKSDESRFHLHDAHSRVMSIATLQRQLANSPSGNVDLRPYFTDLCRSIGASMIADPDQLTLSVDSDEVAVDASISTSLGLIVTELVINALKHAFPNHRPGAIEVVYTADGDAWALSVRDDGVGMPPGASEAKGGLGSSIVQALANQLDAVVTVDNSDPGTRITVAHEDETPARRSAAV